MRSSEPVAKYRFTDIGRTVTAIRRQLADHGIKGGLTVFGGGQEPSAIACVYDFSGVSNSPNARELIRVLEEARCGCASSGEDDVRCYCDD